MFSRSAVQRLALSRAPQRQNSTRTVGRDGSSAVLYGPRMRRRQNEMLATTPAARTTPRAAPHRRNRDDPRRSTLPSASTRPPTTARAPHVEPMPEPMVLNHAPARAAARTHAVAAMTTPTCCKRSRWSQQPDALVLRRCRDHDRNREARPAAATCPTRSKEPDAATPNEKPQLARMKNDPKSFGLCPYNARVSAAAAHHRTGRRRLQTLVRRLVTTPGRRRERHATAQRPEWNATGTRRADSRGDS